MNFLRSHFSELNNITWPTWNQAIHSVLLVLIIMLIVGIFLGIADYLLNEIVSFIQKRLK